MSHGKKITAKDALTLPNGSVCDRGAGWQRIIKTAGRWSSVDYGSAVDSFPDNCTLSFCPDPNWKPEGEKVVEWWSNVYVEMEGMAYPSLEEANAGQDDNPDDPRIAILHVRDGVAELLDTSGKAVKNIGNQIGFLESERDRLAAQVVSLKDDRDKVCEKNAELLDEVESWKKEHAEVCKLLTKKTAEADRLLRQEEDAETSRKSYLMALDESGAILARWRAEAMAGRERLDKDGYAKDSTPTARAAYASARAANEQVSKSAELTITDNAPKPDGGPEALCMAVYDDGSVNATTTTKAMEQMNPSRIGHITLTPGADGVVRWKWTGK